MPSSPRAKRLRWILPIGIAVVTFLAFLPALKNQFVSWDDDVNFLLNPFYRGLSRDSLQWIFTSSYKTGGLYIPLSWLTLAIDYRCWGMNPFGYHLTNLLLHLANVLLVFVVFRKATG